MMDSNRSYLAVTVASFDTASDFDFDFDSDSVHTLDFDSDYNRPFAGSGIDFRIVWHIDNRLSKTDINVNVRIKRIRSLLSTVSASFSWWTYTSKPFLGIQTNRVSRTAIWCTILLASNTS